MEVGPVIASQIKKLRKRFCWVDQPLSRSVLTPISCTKLKIHSAHKASPGSETYFIVLRFTNEQCMKIPVITYKNHKGDIWNLSKKEKKSNLEVGPVIASQINKLRKRFCWVDQPLSRSVLTPISCTKLKIYSARKASPGSETYFIVLRFTDEKCMKNLLKLTRITNLRNEIRVRKKIKAIWR